MTKPINDNTNTLTANDWLHTKNMVEINWNTLSSVIGEDNCHKLLDICNSQIR